MHGIALCCGKPPKYDPWMANPNRSDDQPKPHGPSYFCEECGRYQGTLGGGQLFAAICWNDEFTREGMILETDLPKGWDIASRCTVSYMYMGGQDTETLYFMPYKINEDGFELMNPWSGEVAVIKGLPKKSPSVFINAGEGWCTSGTHPKHLHIAAFNQKWRLKVQDALELVRKDPK